MGLICPYCKRKIEKVDGNHITNAISGLMDKIGLVWQQKKTYEGLFSSISSTDP